MCIAAAIIGGAVLGAGATAIAGGESANAITSSTNASIAAQQSAQGRQQAVLAPYTNLGTGGAISQLQSLTGTGPPGSPSPAATLAATPGYQFAKTQGLSATENAATAMGLGLSGNTLQGLDKFSTGLADQTYEEAVQNAQNQVTIGENAAAGTGAGILQTGANVGSALSSSGNTIAGIDANLAAGLTKSVGSGVNQYITANTLAGLGGSGLPSANYWSDTALNTPGAIPAVGDIPGVTGP